MIQIENLQKSYGSKSVLKNINITFEPGKVYGIVGENGAGKTTLFRCMAGLEMHQGTINSNPSSLKNHLGLLVTDPYFFPKITGLEYLKFMCLARKLSLHDWETKNIFELPLNEYAETYSTGMKKKLALLGILLQENHYFILDEPFNGVDIQSNLIITDIIHQLKALNKTIILSSHIFSTLSDNCDEIHVLKDGTFAQRVTKEDFKKLELEMREQSAGPRISALGLK
jgi:ABC-2 type transport system ATP-binding protein